MKRFLSILLSGLLVFPFTGASAEESDIYTADASVSSSAEDVLSSAEDIPSSAQENSDTEASEAELFASDPSGYFGIDGGKTWEFTQDFEAASPLNYKLSVQVKDNNGFLYERPASYNYTYSSDKALFPSTGSDSKYLTLQTINKAANFIGAYYGVGTIGAGEKVHYSFDLMARDYDSSKSVYLTWRNAVNSWDSVLTMGDDGFMVFGANGTKYAYSLNRWYKFDVVLHFKQGNGDSSGTHNTYIYLDGKLMHSGMNIRNFQTQSGINYYSPNALRFNVGASTGSGESVLCIDNTYGKIYAASEEVSPFTQRKFAYTSYDIPSGAKGSDYFSGEGSGSVVSYSLASGVLGKESFDKSLLVKTAPSVKNATPSGSWSEDNPSTNALMFLSGSIKEDSNYSIGSQLKISMSYAFKKFTPTGGGADYIQLGGKAYGENFVAIDRYGKITATGSDDTFTLADGKWYNIDIILTVNDDTTLGYILYVNGIAAIDGTLDNANLKTDTGAIINSVRLCSYVTRGCDSETYLDDMYIEYFTGTDNDAATANPAIENEKVELGENGVIFLPAGYTVSDLISDTNIGVKVIKDGVCVESGSAENALVATDGLLPVYVYAYVKLKLFNQTHTLDNGILSVYADVQSNQNEAIDVTYIVAVYKDGRIYSVNAASENCLRGTTALAAENIPVPEGAEIEAFAVEGWGTKLPIFDDQIYTVNRESSSGATGDEQEFTAGEFDYDNLSVKLSGTIGDGGIKTGAVYIVKSGDDISALSDGNLPLYAGRVTTDGDGRFALDVKFMSDGTAFDYGTYDAYLYSRSLDKAQKVSFAYLSPEQILDGKKQAVLDAVEESSTWQGMKAVILGEDMDGEVINDNFELIDPDTSDYSRLKNKEKLFTQMFKDKGNIKTFDDIADEFERIAEKLYKEENKSSGGSSGSSSGGGFSGGGSFGASKPVMSTTKTDVETPSQGDVDISFTDINDHWAQKYALALAKNGIINGYDDGTFRPDNKVTRAELAKIIVGAFNVKSAGTSDFADVTPGAWYVPYIDAASSSGIVTGYNGNFNPDSAVTRQDAAIMLYRAISLTHKLGIGYTFFADETSIASYAAEMVSALAEIGIITGNESNEFMPENNLTRAEASALISRAADYIAAH